MKYKINKRFRKFYDANRHKVFELGVYETDDAEEIQFIEERIDLGFVERVEDDYVDTTDYSEDDFNNNEVEDREPLELG